MVCAITLSFAGVAVASGENLFADLSFNLINETAHVPVYPVTFGVGSGEGTLTATANNDTIYSGSEVEEGSVIVFSAMPSYGYQVTNWTVNNSSTGLADPIYMIINHQAAVDVRVLFEAIPIVSKPPEVDNIEVYTSPGKTNYTEGETLDLTGLVITLIKSDTNTENVDFENFKDKGISVSPENGTELSVRNEQVRITHTASRETAIQTITVNAVTVDHMDIKTFPRVIYTAGETLDLTGMVITLTRSDTSTEDVAFENFAVEGISVSPENGTNLEEGVTQVIITHTDSGINMTQAVTVSAASVPVAGINVTGSGNSTKVEKGKTLQVSATVFPADASNKNIQWTVAGIKGTATITQAGLLTGTGEGTVTVTATAVDGSGEAGSLNITVTEAPSITTPASGGAGGSGGGSQTTGENDENIALKDYSIKYIMKDTETVFEFRNENNSILSIGFTTRLNGGQTKTMIEMLKGTSTLVRKAAPGKVYRNVNIWVGDGKITQNLMSDATITFKVEKSWMSENGIDAASIRMCRYNSGAWAQLPTSMTGEDETYVYYNAQTPNFSAFAISSMSEKDLQAVSVSTQEGSSSSLDEEGAQMSAADNQALGADNAVSQEPQSSGTITFLLVLAGISVIGVLSYRYKDNLSQIRMQLGNPDGKRYRRLKRI